MQHDIYSLGACLLEIGLWRSFVWFPDGHDGAAPVPWLGLDLCDQDFTTTSRVVPLRTKDHLVALTARELPPRLGDLYLCERSAGLPDMSGSWQ